MLYKVKEGARMDLSDNKMCPFCMFLSLTSCSSVYFSSEHKIK